MEVVRIQPLGMCAMVELSSRVSRRDISGVCRIMILGTMGTMVPRSLAQVHTMDTMETTVSMELMELMETTVSMETMTLM